MRKKILAVALALLLMLNISAAADIGTLPAEGYVLLEPHTRTVLAEYEPHKELRIASVTKVMTLLLVMEALDSGKFGWEDMVTTSAYANSMGGTQVYLAIGEKMSVRDMVKSIVMASANDAAVAMGEFVGGTAENFVSMMNTRAKELGMEHTQFKNPSGLDEEGHYSCAYDVAVMSAELLKHEGIRPFLTTRMDSLRGGAFDLVNTNKLLGKYDKITGMKTGSTSMAKFCLSATAEDDGMELVAALLGCPTSDERFDAARELLEYGFANYAYADVLKEGEAVGTTNVFKGESPLVNVVAAEAFGAVLPKDAVSRIERKIDLQETVRAPVQAGDKLGTLTLTLDGKELASVDLISDASVEHVKLWDVFNEVVQEWVLMKR